jgi:hypothetical protein
VVLRRVSERDPILRGLKVLVVVPFVPHFDICFRKRSHIEGIERKLSRM